MARLQYQRAARAGGYRPQQVDERNIARMREESSRVIDGMRQAANAEIESRREVARAMKEDAAYTRQAEQKNFQIQTANSNRQIQGLQAQAARDQQQFNINAKETESIFKSITSFSSTANKVVNAIQEREKQERYEEEFYDQDPNANAITQLLRAEKEAAGRMAAQSRLAGIQEAEAKGADPAITAKLKAQDPITQYDFTEATVSKFFRYQYVDERNARLKAAEQEKGAPLTYEEKKQIVAQFRNDIYKLVGSQGLSSDFVKPHLQYADQADTALYTNERVKEQKEDDERRGETHLTIVSETDPVKRQAVFNSSFPHLVDVYGYKGALDKLQSSVFNAQNPKTGEFYWTMDAIQNLVIPTEGKTFGAKYSDKNGNPTGRLAEIQSERIKLDLQFRRQQQAADDLSNAETEQELFRAFKLNPTAANAEQSQRLYVSLTGKESVMLANASKHLTYEAQHRQRVVSAASKLRDFELTPEVVAGVCSVDPTGCRPLKDRLELTQSKWKGAGYKKAKTGLEGAVSGTTSIGTNKPASNGAQPMINHLHAELESRTALYESTLGFEAAYLKAGAELEQEYKNGFRDKDSKYYRKVHRNGTVSYPNLPVGKVSAADAIKRDVDDLRADVKTGGVSTAIKNYFEDHPERVEYIANNYDKPTFRPNPQELALKGMLNGMPLHSMYNEGFKQIGNPTRLASPLQSNGQDIVLTPAQQKIMDDPYAGPNAKLSVLRSVLNPSSFQDHGTMRPGPIANAVRVQTAVSGQGFTAKGLNDAYARPIVFGSSEALSGFQRLIQLSGGKVKASDITSSQRSHVHNEKVGGSATSYHREGTGLAFDISAGPALEWMKANPELVKQAGFSTEPGYTSAHGHYVFGL